MSELAKITALAVLQMEKIMSAELDRLNAAVAANGTAIEAVAAKVAELKAALDALPPSEGPELEAVAAALEGQAQTLANLAATPV